MGMSAVVMVTVSYTCDSLNAILAASAVSVAWSAAMVSVTTLVIVRPRATVDVGLSGLALV